MSNEDFSELLPEGVSSTPSPWHGGGYLYKPGELLSAAGEVRRVEHLLGQVGGTLNGNEPNFSGELSRLEVDIDVPPFVSHLRHVAHERPPDVFPNHVFHHLSHVRFFSKFPPVPANP